MQKQASREVAALDPYKVTVLIGKRVIHPRRRASTESKGFLTDEGFAHGKAIMGQAATQPAHVRNMVWLTPPIAKAARTWGTSPSAARLL